MWLEEEVNDLKNFYSKIKYLSIDQVVDEFEQEQIAASAVYNLCNQVVAPRKLKKYMACVRLQYLATD